MRSRGTLRLPSFVNLREHLSALGKIEALVWLALRPPEPCGSKDTMQSPSVCLRRYRGPRAVRPGSREMRIEGYDADYIRFHGVLGGKPSPPSLSHGDGQGETACGPSVEGEDLQKKLKSDSPRDSSVEISKPKPQLALVQDSPCQERVTRGRHALGAPVPQLLPQVLGSRHAQACDKHHDMHLSDEEVRKYKLKGGIIEEKGEEDTDDVVGGLTKEEKGKLGKGPVKKDDDVDDTAGGFGGAGGVFQAIVVA
ncbi:hypothetical protein GGR57DRAFT_499415 [Xylariaceae sp. FL1272]|nr:hypothetical protein GGR57DRAFT_499415 [Xylariaceae sp. FL1272]